MNRNRNPKLRPVRIAQLDDQTRELWTELVEWLQEHMGGRTWAWLALWVHEHGSVRLAIVDDAPVFAIDPKWNFRAVIASEGPQSTYQVKSIVVSTFFDAEA